MQAEGVPLTRKEFLLTLAAPVLLPAVLPARTGPGKLLIVVAHPDDEYAFAATVYRLVRELGWTADQVVITNGEAGYRYSALAEAVYGKKLANERDGRANLPAIRREETIGAGKILGIAHHYFLDQKDLGFATVAAKADASNWDRTQISEVLDRLLTRERYDAVFALLPTAETHGHHRAATQLAQQAVARLPRSERPLLFGVEAGRGDATSRFAFDRTRSLGTNSALNYHVVVNWVIAEHKSQGLFQMECGKENLEQFWLLDGPEDADRQLQEMRAYL